MTFDNLTPAIPGFYSDPTMCAGPDAVYLAHSSFEYFPGVPLWRSTDLTSFHQLGNVIDRPDQLDLSTFAGPSSGIYGSTLRYHAGRYWFVTTNIRQIQEGQLLFTATNPAGPWSDPVTVPGTIGIDPDLAWDEDGTCYLTWRGFPDGIVQVTIDQETGEVLSDRRPLWAGTGMKAPEGPAPLPRRGLVVPPARRGRHRARPLRDDRPLPPPGPRASNPAHTTRSSPTGQPTTRCSRSGMPTWSNGRAAGGPATTAPGHTAGPRSTT
ncbi:MAG: family 43 glycosylhydrolase [Propionicimonas sp.]